MIWLLSMPRAETIRGDKMSFTRITNTELNSRGATTLPNQPTISAAALKQEFDAPAKNIVAPKVNNLMAELESTAAAASLGMVAPHGRSGATVQSVIADISGGLTAVEETAHSHDNKTVIDKFGESGESPTYNGTIIGNGDSVEWQQAVASGTKIAQISINGISTDVFAPTSGGGGGASSYASLSDLPQINSNELLGNKTAAQLGLASAVHTHTKSQITDFPALANVATSGSYNDLLNKPSIPTADVTYNPLSANAQSGVAVASAISTKADDEDLDTWTSAATQLNGAVVFDNLNPNYGYDLYLYQTTNGIVPNAYPTQTVQATGTQTGTIKLTYTISGGVDGSTQFKLRINK